MDSTAPAISRSVVAIIDRENVALGAAILSYISIPGQYTPLFGFPNIRDAQRAVKGLEDDDYFANVIGGNEAVLLYNAISRLRDVQLVVLGGLSAVQKSYLRFPDHIRVIEVSSLEDAAPAMAAAGFARLERLKCCRADALIGLKLALESERALVIDETAARLETKQNNRQGLVIIEARLDHVGSVVAVNYARAIDADVKFVRPLEEKGRRAILDQLYSWKYLGDDAGRAYVIGEVIDRVADSDLSSRSFVTCFTDGIPYAIALRSEALLSLVNLSDRVDHFTLNGILAEREPEINSAVVFSLENELGQDEGRWLEEELRLHGWAVRGLYNDSATHNAFDYHAQHFVYRLLHIASHGRELDGYRSIDEFTDRNGDKHVFEYDEVVNFEPPPLPNGDMVACIRKVIPRSLDGKPWNSEELRALNLPEYVTQDMSVAVFGPGWGEGTQRTPKSRIGEGYVVQCHEGFHQGLLRAVAGHGSPFVFNNSCWSWGDMASSFISAGAHAYIGTLWSVSNDSAILVAKAFYKKVFSSTILEALHDATEVLRGKETQLYVFWGFHFSTIKCGESVFQSTSAMARGMLRSLYMWLDAVDNASSEEVRENAVEVATLLAFDIIRHLSPPKARSLVREVDARLKKWGKSLKATP